MSEGVMTYPWSDFRRSLNRVTSIGPWICHNTLRHIHGMTLFLKGKNDTCLFFFATLLVSIWQPCSLNKFVFTLLMWMSRHAPPPPRHGFWCAVECLSVHFSCAALWWRVWKDLTYITEHHFDARWRSKAAAVNIISSQLEKMIAVFILSPCMLFTSTFITNLMHLFN